MLIKQLLPRKLLETSNTSLYYPEETTLKDMLVCQLFQINHFHRTKVSKTEGSNSVHNIFVDYVM